LTGPQDFYNKHKNVELPAVNFTDIPHDEFLKLMFASNKEVIKDYYNHLSHEVVEKFYDVYFKAAVSFRGARHV